MTLSDRIAQVTRIMTECPETNRLAGVLRIVKAMQAEIDAATCMTFPGERGCGPNPPRTELKFGREEAELINSLNDRVLDDSNEPVMPMSWAPTARCACGHEGSDHTPVNPVTHMWACRVVGCNCWAWVPMRESAR